MVGVAGESFFGVRIWWNNRKLQAIQRSENIALQLKISEANDRATEAESHLSEAKSSAAQAELHAAEANERAAEATEAAEREKLERIKLEALIQARHLTLAQQKAVGDACRPFSNPKVRVEVIPFVFDLDGMRLAKQIAAALRYGEMNVAITVPVLPMAGAEEGVIVSSSGSEQKLGRTIADSLNAVGIFAATGPVITQEGLVSIRVGIKPPILLEK